MTEPYINVELFPDNIYIEKGVFQQSVNFEFRFYTDSDEPLELQEVNVDGYDEACRLLFTFPLNSFGFIPPILLVTERKVERGKTLEIFNPIPNYPTGYAINRLHYKFKFRSRSGIRVEAEKIVLPAVYEQKRSLVLPFKGTCLVTEGHDYFTHHRRNFPLFHPIIQKIGIKGNNSRFAYDFVLLDDELKMYEDTPTRNEDFFCWGKPILGPGDGEIVALERNSPDNSYNTFPAFDVEAHIRDPETEMKKHLGNFLMIDHGGGEYSVLAHMMKGSVKSREGATIRKGEMIGRLGNSGDSFFPHLHYQLQNGPGILKPEGLPSKFESFDLMMGNEVKRLENACPNTGMIVKS
jgi:hypothetical protein